MQCAAFEARLNQLLDERLPPEDDGDLRAHALHCDDCGELLHGQQLLLEGLYVAECPLPSDGFSHAVVESAVANRPHREWVAVVMGIAVAASIMGVAFLRPASQPGMVNSPQPQTVTIVPTGPSLAIANDHTLAFEQLDPAAKEDLRLIVRSMMGPVHDADEPIEGVSELAEGLRPVGATLGGALNAIRRTIPGQQKADADTKL